MQPGPIDSHDELLDWDTKGDQVCLEKQVTPNS